MNETERIAPLPGSRAAIGEGCTCTRQGWTWQTKDCIVHDHTPMIIAHGRGLCTAHGEPADHRTGLCPDCEDRRGNYAAMEQDMRALPQRGDWES